MTNWVSSLDVNQQCLLAGSILEIEAQIEMLEAEVSILKRSGQNSLEFDRLVNAERRLRDALICAEELDKALQFFHQSFDYQESLNSYNRSLEFFHGGLPFPHTHVPNHQQVKTNSRIKTDDWHKINVICDMNDTRFF